MAALFLLISSAVASGVFTDFKPAAKALALASFRPAIISLILSSRARILAMKLPKLP